jgi:short-subunit dehydrogenase
MSSFAGKKIWLVGASEGIGEAVAKSLATAGAQVCLSARNLEKLQALVGSLAGTGHLALQLDVTKDETVRAAWQTLSARWGNIDVVMYNAGTYDPLSVRDFDLSRTQFMVDVNFLGALRVLNMVVPAMVAAKKGHIVLVASVAAYSGLPKALGYGASKAALLHLAENMYLDLEEDGIKVQVINPGFVKTRLTDKNEFKMPFIITPEQAAAHIVKGMESSRFEIHFPKGLSCTLKFCRLLPYRLYFWLIRRLG